ncbi:hypothetical protein [Arthrobacter sp.]|uniref:hypothetical protein n=1 Tax=Arthrobacter sp. TaxID=1667 RepID=UPI0026DF7833|nr:hypothetical protein [Arthrobacter sp.]MDO5752663.1 hypothetical protein [Arthrobacter sp.]
MNVSEHAAVIALNAALDAAGQDKNPRDTHMESLTAHRRDPAGTAGYLVSIKGTSPYFVGSDGKAQHVDIDSFLQSETELRVYFAKAGGIVGKKVTLSLSNRDGTLTTEAESELRTLINNVDFFNASQSNPGSMIFDGYSYSVTVAMGHRSRTIDAEQGSDSEMLGKIGPLLAWLEARAPSLLPKIILD